MGHPQVSGGHGKADFGGVPPTVINTVPQAVGLVPMFACCESNKAAVAGTMVQRSENCTITLNVIIGGVNYGSVAITIATSGAAIQTAINLLLAGTGITCQVTIQNLAVFIIFTAPSGYGADYNGVEVACTATGCVRNVYNIDFFGGVNGANFCGDCDCREGKYTADEIPDDRNFMLPVFADLKCSDDYHNDYNGFALKFPIGYTSVANGDWKLQKLQSGAWDTLATLNNGSYGTIIATNCTNFNYQGYLIQWRDVLRSFGEGIYRILAESASFCQRTPPFCLKQFDCLNADQTIKIKMDGEGGTFGSVTKQGDSTSLCCKKTTGNTSLRYTDSVRIPGFFGYETAEFSRDYIKYASGYVNHVRDEAIKNYTLKTDMLPIWLHQRLYAYAFQSQNIYISDYNVNNADYNLKNIAVIADSAYTPQYRNYSRYMRVNDMKFKEQTQFIYKDRCC